jgi:hypothetical protein
METAFNWFLGNNRLHQIIYNPCTGGCYDGLEETHVNLNQGAESTVSYLMARLTIEKYKMPDKIISNQVLGYIEKKQKKEQVNTQVIIEHSAELTPYYFITNPLGETIKESNNNCFFGTGNSF